MDEVDIDEEVVARGKIPKQPGIGVEPASRTAPTAEASPVRSEDTRSASGGGERRRRNLEVRRYEECRSMR